MTTQSSRQMDDLAFRLEDLAMRLLDLPGSHAAGVPPAWLLTSARGGEGKTTMSVLLAQVLARVCGERVLLVDANFYRPDLQRTFGIPAVAGLSETLRKHDPVSDIPVRNIGDGVTVVTAGQALEPILLTRGDALAAFRQRVSPGYRCVLFDGAETRLGGAALAKHVDGVLMVIDSSATRREVVAGAVREMRIPAERMIGAVLNKRRHYIPAFFYKGL